jgi:hypothetical protein
MASLRNLLQCRSVIVTHPLTWVQHFHHLFDSNITSPTRNMVEVPLSLERHLAKAIEHLQDHDEVARRIASNSWQLFQRYLSPAAK